LAHEKTNFEAMILENQFGKYDFEKLLLINGFGKKYFENPMMTI